MTKWIKTEDKTPEDLVSVLMFIETEVTKLHPEPKHFMAVGTFKGGKEWVIGNHFAWDMGKCLYWMPLPECPKIKGKLNLK